MQVHALKSAPPLKGGMLRYRAPHLIELCGTPKFEAALFEAIREVSDCAHLTAFAFSPAAPPRVLLAINTGEIPVAQLVAEKYLHRFWMLDPASRVSLAPAAANDRYAIRISTDDIDDTDYRDACYTTVDLEDRISIMTSQKDEMFRINFYKSPGCGPFTPKEMDHLFESSDLIMALLAKNDAAGTPRQGKSAAKMFEQRLKLMAVSLPKRETEICTLIATGLSSEGIALELGISLNTVLTYRKRAYARLGISSQNELLRLLLS